MADPDPRAYNDCARCGTSALACYGKSWDGKRCCTKCVHRVRPEVAK